MAIERINLISKIGQFDHVAPGREIKFARLNLIYAENGRGKTTLATVLNSLSAGDSALIEDRHRLGAVNPPHIVLSIDGEEIVYQNRMWSRLLPNISVFNDAFIANNICSGLEIETNHRKNLHELVLGASGVALNKQLQQSIAAIELHNRNLASKESAIQLNELAGMTVDAFCALAVDNDIDRKIQEAQQNLSAANSADSIRQTDLFHFISLPQFDLAALNDLLARGLPEVQSEAAARVRDHLRQLGHGGEAWVVDGMSRIAADIEGANACPFCEQDLGGSLLIRHYDVYFGVAYKNLRSAIIQAGQGIAEEHSSNAQEVFERAIRIEDQKIKFWRDFTSIPEIELDAGAIIRNWTKAREVVLNILRAKAAAPLDAIAIPNEAVEAVETFARDFLAIIEFSTNLIACNPQIEQIKEQSAQANVAELAKILLRLEAVKFRQTLPLKTVCDAYVAEKDAKAESQRQRDAAREALAQYRTSIFQSYERSINDFLGRFTAGFRLGQFSATNTRAGSSATYNILINDVPIELAANEGPSFRTTLSAGDRNTLALAFFFASLESNENLSDSIVVIDDPMTSLDEHRRLATVEEVRKLVTRVRQVFVLSHSKSFLCDLWEGLGSQPRSALRINRDSVGSTLEQWEINQDCITEHDKRHQLVTRYIREANPAEERKVGEALRPILEAYMRIAYPDVLSPGKLLKDFFHACGSAVNGSSMMNADDISELQQLVRYANRFHHDNSSSWRFPDINDQELVRFAERTLLFTSRRRES